jgi:hypothetical protein
VCGQFRDLSIPGQNLSKLSDHAYVIFEGPECVLEWRISDIRGTIGTNAFDRRLCDLLNRYNPDTVLVRKLPERATKTRGNRLSQ